MGRFDAFIAYKYCDNVIIIGVQNLAKFALHLEVQTKKQERYMGYITVNGIQQGVSGTY